MLHRASDLDGFFGTTKATENGYEIWYVSEKHTVSIFISEDGDILFLRNVGIYLRVYAAPNPKQHRHSHRRENLKSHKLDLVFAFALVLYRPDPPPPPRGSTVLGEPLPPPYVRFRNRVFRQLVVLLGREVGPSQGLYLHRTTQHKKDADTWMLRVGFEPTIPISKRSRFTPYNERPLWSETSAHTFYKT
jgi:hypothetical protein